MPANERQFGLTTECTGSEVKGLRFQLGLLRQNMLLAGLAQVGYGCHGETSRFCEDFLCRMGGVHMRNGGCI